MPGLQQHSNRTQVANLGRRFLRRLDRLCHDTWVKLARKRVLWETQEEWPRDKPLVTVIIPCYNYGKYIREAIESVQAQTLARLDIIVINDGSTDEFTLSVLANLKYPNTHVVHQTNRGLAETRNIGAQMSSGKYICYLDADDTIHPNYLQKAISILEADLNVGVCYSWVQCFGASDKIWKTRDLDPFYVHQYTTASSHGVIRRTAWEAIRMRNGTGFITEFNGYFEDWVFWIDMIEVGYRGVAIKEPLIHYRVHQDSLSARHRGNFNQMLENLRLQRPAFFCSAQYRRSLCKKLHRHIYVRNPHVEGAK